MIAQYRPLIDRKSLAKELSDYTLSDGFFTEYKKTEEFEQRLARFLEIKHCIVVNNGTLSLSLALLALGIKPGDKVIVPNITMIATYNAVKLIGAIPLLVDVDERNLCLDLKKVKELIVTGWQEIKAVIYVTLNGRSHPINEYVDFELTCRLNNISIVEDNAQSLGSWYLDSFKISAPLQGIGSFSFSMPKIITTGQGGCLVTNDPILAQKIRKLKDFGRLNGGIDIHDTFGINSKFTELQAIMGINQLENINWRVDRKREIYNRYKQKLKNIPEITFLTDNWILYTPWFVDIYVERRDNLASYLKDFEIGTRKIYPELTSQITVHQNKFWKQKSMKVSKKYTEKGLWLPSSLDISNEQIDFVCNKIKEFYVK